jgi:aryl-alcohol dehydrogenase-like predicted oxidoreductase
MILSKCKIALGTVQFGINYGITNNNGIPSDKELEKIIEICITNDIDTIDSASLYGNAEARLGKFNAKGFKIIGKFKGTTDLEIRTEFKKTLSDLRVDFLYGYLSHRANDILVNPDLWKTILQLKEDNLILKAGVSVYFPEELDAMKEIGIQPDIIQLPYNLLDRRMSIKIKEYAAQGTEIHVRSVFLQGLFFMNTQNLPQKLSIFKEPLEQIQLLATENTMSLAELALNYVLMNPNIHRVVVGVQTKKQLMELMNIGGTQTISSKLVEKIEEIKIKEESMLLPQNW